MILNFYIKLLFIIVIFSYPTLSNAEMFSYQNKILSNNDGLSNSSVNTIFQDRNGIMWFGTWDGLNKYDGNTFRQYRPQSNDPNSISHHVIRSIAEENDEYLWITTDYGINRMDKKTERFEHFFLGYNNPYIYQEKSFSCDVSKKGIIVATFKGSTLYIYNKKENVFIPVVIKNSSKYKGAKKVFFDNNDNLWLQETNGDLLKIAISDKHEAEMVYRIKLPDNIEDIFYDRNNNVWFSSGNYLGYIELLSQTPELKTTKIKINGTLNDAYFNKSNIIIGTTDGCYSISFDHIITTIEKEISVLSVFSGSQDIIWAGTDGKGVIKHFHISKFIEKFNTGQTTEMGQYPIRAIFKDKDNNLWIGSKGGGLTLIKNNKVTANYNVGAGKTHNSVLELSNGDNCLWIGTDGPGIKYFDYKSNSLKTLNTANIENSEKIYSIYSIIQADSLTVYVGTSGEGLFKIELDKSKNVRHIKQFKHTKQSEESGSINSNIIYDILKDNNKLWIATRGGGLNIFDLQTETFESFRCIPQNENSICSNDLTVLHKDNSGRIWIGSSSGISILSTDSTGEEKFTTLNENSGLANSNIHAIEEDNNGNIWVSTSNGISRINSHTKQITNFYYEDGLQNNEFSDGAGYANKAKDEIYFGGVNGFNIIYPQLMREKSFKPNLIIDNIKIDNNLYIPEDNIINTSYKTTSISISLSITDYIDNNKCQIVYRIVKADNMLENKTKEQWIQIGNSRKIILNGLSPNKYKIEIKASNADQVWDMPQTLELRISPPLWRTGWAISIYILVFIASSVIFYKIKKSKLVMRHALEMEKQEKIKKEEIHQAKLRFFTNIAHEFSNSITLIYGAVEQIFTEQPCDSKERKQLLTIHQNAERMHRQIQELMEFRKADTGHLQIQLTEVDVNELIKCTCDNFLDIAESKKIEIKLNLASNIPAWVTDRSMLEKIIFNLLSNAMKYTPNEGDIAVTAQLDNNGQLMFECKNSGPGIRPDDLPNIFNRFTILDNYESKMSQGMTTRNGIGLALCKDLVNLLGGKITVKSEVNDYTSFIVTLPQKAKEEIQTTIVKKEIQFKTKKLFDKQKPTILIVDDQPDIINLIKDILGADYETIGAANGLEAIETLKTTIPSLIICDIVMPKMSGTELISKIKDDEQTKYIPIIILSSKSSIENQIAMLETGASFFINKPFHPRYLKAAVDRLLYNKDLMRTFSESSTAYKEKYNDNIVSKDDKQFIDNVIEVLSKNYNDENYNQDALAQDLMISRIQLYRKIKQIAQTTPGDFIRTYRLKQAENMLIHTDKTIQEIMLECGFHNKAYFYREFAKIHNCSPKDFRTKEKEKNK